MEGPENENSCHEVQEALKKMNNNKAPRPSGMNAEMLQTGNQEGWLKVIVNKFLNEEKLPEDLKASKIVTIYKHKRDLLECGNYRGIKIMEAALNVHEKVTERQIRKKVKIHSIQFRFMPGKDK